MTEIAENKPARGWVFYDGCCVMCQRQVGRWEKTFQKRGFMFVPLQEEWVQRQLGLTNRQVPEEMKLVTSHHRVRGGLDAILHLAWHLWWARPLIVFGRLPGIVHLLRAIYRQVAKRRYCFAGSCELPNV